MAETCGERGSVPSLTWHRNFLRPSGKTRPNSGRISFFRAYARDNRTHNLGAASFTPYGSARAGENRRLWSKPVDRNKPLNARLPEAGGSGGLPRRSFLKMAAGVAAAGIFGGSLSAFAAQSIQMPFENGRRKLIRFPQKGEMIQLRERPPLLETPFAVFDQGVFTPNDQFFVRWHLPVIPNAIDVDTFRLGVDGHVRPPTEFTLKEILQRPDQVELAAV